MCNQFNAIQLCAHSAVRTDTHNTPQSIVPLQVFRYSDIGTCCVVYGWYSALKCIALLPRCLFCISITLFILVYVLVCIDKPAVHFVWLAITHAHVIILSFSLFLSLSHFCIECSMRNTDNTEYSFYSRLELINKWLRLEGNKRTWKEIDLQLLADLPKKTYHERLLFCWLWEPNLWKYTVV